MSVGLVASAHHEAPPVGGDATVTFVAGTVNLSSGTSYSLPFTVPAAGAIQVLCVTTESTQSGLESSLATANVDGVDVTPAANGHHLGVNTLIFAVAGLTAGAHTLAVSYTGAQPAQARCGLAHYAVTGAALPPADADTAGAVTATTSQLTLDVPKGAVIVTAYTTGTGVTYTWTGVIEDVDVQPSGNTGMSAGHANAAAATGAVLVKVDHAESSQPVALAAVVLAPA